MGIFLLIQVGVMLLAISHESFWIDEFWSAYFASLKSFEQLIELILIPNGSQTPLHFSYYYFWGQVFPISEASLRLANLPLFVLGQISIFWGLRSYSRFFAYCLLTVNALHPMVWQYANEVRPYMMMYAGASMILAYLLHINAIKESQKHVETVALAIFVVGSIMLFGASLLGVFWVAAACVYIAHFHVRYLDWRYLKDRLNILLFFIFLVTVGLLTIYYLSSLIQGAGGSRLATTTVVTLVFDAYELLGLSGIGPGRLELRDSGVSALSPYLGWLIPACMLIFATLLQGVQVARCVLGTRVLLALGVLAVSPVAIVVLSGFVMQWRVLGRHMIAELPLLNLLFALGLAALYGRRGDRARPFRMAIAAGFLVVLVASSLGLRYAERHRKDDYQAAAAFAKQELAAGKRVWWAADALGAWYYGLPGEFDYIGELTGRHTSYTCMDQSGVLSVVGASADCLDKLQQPDVVILSKPETFDTKGVIAAYLKGLGFVKGRELPAFTIWLSARPDGASTANARGTEVRP